MASEEDTLSFITAESRGGRGAALSAPQEVLLQPQSCDQQDQGQTCVIHVYVLFGPEAKPFLAEPRVQLLVFTFVHLCSPLFTFVHLNLQGAGD